MPGSLANVASSRLIFGTLHCTTRPLQRACFPRRYCKQLLHSTKHRQAHSCRRSRLSPCNCSDSTPEQDATITGKSQDLASMLGRATALKTVGTAALESIAQQGAEEELPANYKLAEDGMAPGACHFLLSHGTFLKKNNEGTSMVRACCFGYVCVFQPHAHQLSHPWHV